MTKKGAEQILNICCTVTPLVSVLYSSFSYEQFLSTRCYDYRVVAKASVFRAGALVASFSVPYLFCNRLRHTDQNTST